MKKKINNYFIFYFFLLASFFLAFRFFFTPCLWHFHDEMQPFWLFEWVRGLHLGQFPVRWAPDLVWGAGYPLFTFIYPLPYYLGGFLNLLGFSLASSFKLEILLLQLVGLLFFNLALLTFFKPRKAANFLFLLATNLIFLAFPYRAVDLYVRGALGEIALYFSLPFWFYAFFSYYNKKKRIYFYLTALAYAFIILSHNIGAYFLTPFLAVLFFYAELKNGVWPALKNTALVFILGAGLSAFFWLPALVQKPLMADNPIFNVTDHFPFLKQLVWSKWGYGASHWGPNDDLSFQLGPASWLALASAFFVFLVNLAKGKKSHRLAGLFLAFLLVVFYLVNIRSLWWWQHLPFLNYFQFPWRLLLVLNFFLPPFYFFAFFKNKPGRFLTILNVVIILLSTGQLIFFFKPQKLVKLRDEYFFNRYLPTGQLYFYNSEEYLRLPKESRRPSRLYLEIMAQSDKAEIKIEKKTFSELTALINNSKKENFVLRRLYFPSWQIEDNKQPLRYKKTPQGLISFALPPGQHKIVVTLRQTPIERIADFVSLLFLVILLAKLKKTSSI